MNTKTTWHKIIKQDTLENALIDGPPANIDEYEQWLFAKDFDFETTCFSDKENGDLVYVRMVIADVERPEWGLGNRSACEHDRKREKIQQMSNKTKTILKHLEEEHCDIFDDLEEWVRDGDEDMDDSKVREVLEGMTEYELLEAWLEWNGIIGHTDDILTFVSVLQGGKR